MDAQDVNLLLSTLNTAASLAINPALGKATQEKAQAVAGQCLDQLLAALKAGESAPQRGGLKD